MSSPGLGVASAFACLALSCATSPPEGRPGDATAPQSVAGEPAQIEEAEGEWHRSIQWPERTFADAGMPELKVLPVDSDGQPVRARAAVIYKNGGSNSATCEGPRVLNGPASGTATLTVTTEDGRIAWRPVSADEGPVKIPVTQPGAFLEVELAREEDTRIAVFKEGVRIHDYTLRPGKKATFVVPVGEVEFGLTLPDGGGQPTVESFREGERTFVRLD